MEKYTITNKTPSKPRRKKMTKPSNPVVPIPQILENGLILIKKGVSVEDQVKIAKISKDMSEKFKISAKARFRIYDALTTYSNQEYLTELANKFINLANNVDKTILTDSPTHLLFLRYEKGSRLGLHRDDGDNDGKGLNPVVSFSIGNACDFIYKHQHTDIDNEIRLESGDVLLFGGNCRHMLHKVRKVHQKTCLPDVRRIVGDCRLNLTFRHAPEILGQEKNFEVFNYKMSKFFKSSKNNKQK